MIRHQTQGPCTVTVKEPAAPAEPFGNSEGLPDRAAFFELIADRLEHAYAKHGREPWSRHELWGIIEEEFIELKEAIMADGPTADVLDELVDIIAVGVRYMETGDRHRGDHPPLRTTKREGGGA